MKRTVLLNTLCLAACTLGLTGCPADDQQASAGASNRPAALAPGAGRGAVFANQLGGSGTGAKLRVVQLDVYQLIIPLGAISRSEEFWKHVEEERVDVGTYDLLRKNGWRIGIAPTAEWTYFRDIIDQYPASSTPRALSAGATGANSVMEMSMKEAIPYQVLSYFNDENRLFLRTFERCDNLLNIALQQVPRKPGEARVTICPTVRALRRRFEITTKNDERVIEYTHPERLYDLNLEADIPMGQFLVVAPSPEVKWKTSLGASFLVQDGAAEQLEEVLLLVPRVTELEETTPSAAAK